MGQSIKILTKLNMKKKKISREIIKRAKTYLLTWLLGCGLEAGDDTVVFVGELAALVVTEFTAGVLFTVTWFSGLSGALSLVLYHIWRKKKEKTNEFTWQGEK